MTLKDGVINIGGFFLGSALGISIFFYFFPENFSRMSDRVFHFYREHLPEAVYCSIDDFFEQPTWKCTSPLSPALEQELEEQLLPYLTQNNYYESPVLIVSGVQQKLYITKYTSKGDLVFEHSTSVSTAAAGLGNTFSGERTPLGLHQVAEIYGQHAQSGEIFSNWEFTGSVAPVYKPNSPPSHDVSARVLSRVIRLKGLEESNKNTHNRNIYFHGTNREDQLGTPASHGCIRVANDWAIYLATIVKSDKTPVYISSN